MTQPFYEKDSTLVLVVVALIIVFLTTVILWFVRRSSVSRRSILLLGLSDSGKTLLFSQLVHNKQVQSVSSIKENVGKYQPQNKGELTIVDIPGQERLRSRFLDQYKDSARAIVFVVDSLTVQKDIRDVAECLYNILSDGTISKNNIPMLVLANKQDQLMAKSAKLMESLIEREMKTLGDLGTKQLESTEGQNQNELDWEKCALRVQFCEGACSSSEGKQPNLEGVSSWLQKVA